MKMKTPTTTQRVENESEFLSAAARSRSIAFSLLEETASDAARCFTFARMVRNVTWLTAVLVVPAIATSAFGAEEAVPAKHHVTAALGLGFTLFEPGYDAHCCGSAACGVSRKRQTGRRAKSYINSTAAHVTASRAIFTSNAGNVAVVPASV